MTLYLRASQSFKRRALAPPALLQRFSSSSFLESLVNWEQVGIPAGAGTASSNAFDLGRMHRLLYKLGDPHMQIKAVHIAGSKGKGSTSVLVTEMLRAAGHKVGLYTSPHMQHVAERISTAPLSHLSPGDWQLLVKDYEPLLTEQQQQEQGALSHFEALTALAFRHFADEQVDLAVIETGMGGLTDATNVIPASKLQLAVITALGFEHAAALGGSLQSIAAAKAGIMKAGRPVVVSAQQHEEALQVVLQHAATAGCEALQAEQLVKVQHRSFQAAADEAAAGRSAVCEVLEVSSGGLGGAGAAPLSLTCSASLVGRHQHANIAAAVTAALKLRDMGWSISDEHIKAGIQQAHLPGRFQVLALDPPGSNRHVVLDGAHSAESAAALVSTLQHVFPQQPVVLVLAMAADKEHRAVIDQLRGCAPRAVIFTEVAIAGSQTRSCSPGVLAGQWQAAIMTSPSRSRCRQLIQASLPAAIDKARHELSACTGPGVICVTGSLHAAAQALCSFTER